LTDLGIKRLQIDGGGFRLRFAAKDADCALQK
jgi:hypothetical protein